MQQQAPHSRRFSSRVATPGDVYGSVRGRSPASRGFDEKASRIWLDFEVSKRRTEPAGTDAMTPDYSKQLPAPNAQAPFIEETGANLKENSSQRHGHTVRPALCRLQRWQLRDCAAESRGSLSACRLSRTFSISGTSRNTSPFPSSPRRKLAWIPFSVGPRTPSSLPMRHVRGESFRCSMWPLHFYRKQASTRRTAMCTSRFL